MSTISVHWLKILSESATHTQGGLCPGAYPSLWTESPICSTFQKTPLHRPHGIIQRYQALQLLRGQETGKRPQPEGENMADLGVAIQFRARQDHVGTWSWPEPGIMGALISQLVSGLNST